jgi:hypothetical protein
MGRQFSEVNWRPFRFSKHVVLSRRIADDACAEAGAPDGTMKTQGEIEAAICDGISRFEPE